MIIKTKMKKEKAIEKMEETFKELGYEFDISPSQHWGNLYNTTFGKEILFKISFKESLFFLNKIKFTFNESNISNSMFLILIKEKRNGIKRFLGAIDYYTLVMILRYIFKDENHIGMKQLKNRVRYLRKVSLEEMSDESKYSIDTRSKIITKYSILDGIQSSHKEDKDNQDFIIEGLDSVINNNLVDEDIAKEAIKIKEMYEKKQEEIKLKRLKENANNEALQVLQAVKMHLEMRGDSLE